MCSTSTLVVDKEKSLKSIALVGEPWFTNIFKTASKYDSFQIVDRLPLSLGNLEELISPIISGVAVRTQKHPAAVSCLRSSNER
jgi:hypothetical protein